MNRHVRHGQEHTGLEPLDSRLRGNDGHLTRRRKWKPEEKAALLAEVEAEGGRVSVVARRHGLSESLVHNWRSAWKAAGSTSKGEPVEFVAIAVIDRTGDARPALLTAPARGHGKSVPARS